MASSPTWTRAAPYRVDAHLYRKQAYDVSNLRLGTGLLTCMSVAAGTTAGPAHALMTASNLQETSAAPAVVQVIPAPALTVPLALGEIRRRTGMTWDQLADYFSVSRRAVHHWASGAKMTAKNEQNVYKLLTHLRLGETGSPQANRAALLSNYSLQTSRAPSRWPGAEAEWRPIGHELRPLELGMPGAILEGDDTPLAAKPGRVLRRISAGARRSG